MSRSLIFGCLLLATPVLAQKTAPNERPQQPPQTLAEALKSTYWNTEQRGPLLAVAPARVGIKPVKGQYTPPPLPPENGYNALEVSAFFDHQPFRTGGVTVVAPKTMRLFTRPTMPPEQAVALSREEAGMELLTSLSSGQWKQLGSENGLGLGDLTEKQKPYFLTLLPSKMTLYPIYRSGEVTNQPQQPQELGASQLQNAHLRLARRLQLNYFIEGKNNHQISFGDEENASQRFQLNASYGDSDDNDNRDPLTARLYPKVPNRLKPSDIDYAHPRLNLRIALSEIKTVGELLTRIGVATQLTFKADYRITNLDIYIRGESARIGDVLQALSLGVCGAFRKLDNTTYLLTEDREGLTTRQAAYDQWMEKVQQLRQKRQEERVKKMEANGAAIPTDNAEGLSPELLKKTDNVYRPQKQGEEPGIAISELPESYKKRVDEASKREFSLGDENGATTPGRIRSDRVSLRAEPQTLWVLPGMGSFRNHELNIGWSLDMALRNKEFMPEPQKPITEGALFAPSWKDRVLVLAPQSVEEAKEAVGLAKQAGLNTLWVLVPLDAAKAKTLLEAALAAGKAAGIAVGAQVSTMAAAPEPLLDLNPLGEPYSPPWYGPSSAPPSTRFPLAPSPVVAQRLTTLINGLAQLPGMGAVNFNGSFPGYQRDYYEPNHRVLGYLPENRTAFFAQTGSDIFDVPTRQYSSYPVSLGHFSNLYQQHIRLPDGNYGPDPTFKDMGKDWSEFRQKQLQNFLGTLDPTLKSLPCPCYSSFPNSSIIGLWKLPDMKKPLTFSYTGDGTDYEQFMLVQARRQSPVALHQVSLWFQSKPEDIVATLRYMTKNASKAKQNADGVVLDFSQRSLAEAKKFILALAPLKSAPTR